MKRMSAEEFGKGYEYEEAKRKQRRQDRNSRNQRKGRKGQWDFKPADE